MRNLLFLACLIAISSSSYSQPVCGFDRMHKARLQRDPLYKKTVEQNEQFVQRYIAKNKARISARTHGDASSYVIPVVVHVMHTGDPIGTVYNPTDAQIHDAINYLNQVYNGTYSGMQGIGDLQIQFELAVRDPNCNNTTGIERIDASEVEGYVENGVRSFPTSLVGVDELEIKNLSRWSPSQYYNIWIVNKIDGQDGTSGIFTAGFASFPTAPSAFDGTIMLATQMVAGQRTLPHEIGHAFGLYHTFEGSDDVNSCPQMLNCETDGDWVCDTDYETFNRLNGVVNFTCRTGINPCTGTEFNSNTESNFMNYTRCYNLFTAGQKARMLAFVESPYRKSLTTSLALSPGFPIANFSAPTVASCTPVTNPANLNIRAVGILSVDLNGRSLGSSLTSDDKGYVDGTTSCLNLVRLVKGSTYTITVNVAGINEEQVRAWIDFNNDGIFSNSTEQVLFKSSVPANAPSVSASFIVPNTTPLNTMIRMRVIDDASTVFSPEITSACTNPVYGQAEDYPIYISSSVLPVTLSAFGGFVKNDKVLLSWSTSMEQDLKNFDIEKSSTGTGFKKIASVDASSNTVSPSSYSYTDANLVQDNYYRLRMNDVDGSYKLSEIVLVRFNGTGQKLTVINNPFNGYIEMKLGKPGADVKLQMINTLGAVVSEKEIASSSTQIKWNMPANLAKGHYVVRAIVDNEMFTSKVIKQ